MSFVVCPILPFPNIYWWTCALKHSSVLLDRHEYFEKMSFRNRYMIATASGALTLSIPLVEGRQQRKAMNEVVISTDSNWQKQHWNTLQTAYNRSPYFEFFKADLAPLFHQPYSNLSVFSKTSIELVSQLLGIRLDIHESEIYQKNYLESDIRADFRTNHYNKFGPQRNIAYHQTFQERVGFLPNLSILDLLFAEGRNALAYLQ